MELAAVKVAAHSEARDYAEVMAVSCAFAVFLQALQDDEVKAVTALLHLDFRQLCLTAIRITLFMTAVANDPPDTNFMQVTLPTPAPITPTSIRCAKRITRHACEQVGLAMLRYRNALARTEAAAGGLATTLNRFSGAAQAGSAAGQFLQAAAAKAYAGELASALAAGQTAARSLASWLRATHTDFKLGTRSRQVVVGKLSSPAGLPASIVSKLMTDGATSGATELSQTLAPAAAGLPRTVSLVTALTVAPTPAPLTALQRTLTVYGLAALVRGLAGQAAVSSAAGESLLNDLRQVVTAATPAARNPAVAQFVKDAGTQVTGPAATLLIAAGGALAG